MNYGIKNIQIIIIKIVKKNYCNNNKNVMMKL